MCQSVCNPSKLVIYLFATLLFFFFPSASLFPRFLPFHLSCFLPLLSPCPWSTTYSPHLRLSSSAPLSCFPLAPKHCLCLSFTFFVLSQFHVLCTLCFWFILTLLTILLSGIVSLGPNVYCVNINICTPNFHSSQKLNRILTCLPAKTFKYFDTTLRKPVYYLCQSHVWLSGNLKYCGVHVS